MILRPACVAASLFGLAFSAAIVAAQSPAGSDELLAPAAESPLSPADEMWLFNDGFDLSARLRFQADLVYFTRHNNSNSLPVVAGAESFSLDDVRFNHQSGYRLTLGFVNDDFELEGSFFDLNSLTASQSGTLTNLVVFDGIGGFTSASDEARIALGDFDGTPFSYIETTTLFAPINAAANFPSADAGADETSELEYLDPGAQFRMRYRTELQDFDLNLKGRRQPGRLLRFGIGYRNILLEELGSAALRGTFNTLDVDGVEVPDAENAENNALSETALTDTTLGGRLTATTGGDFLEAVPSDLLFISTMKTSNRLNGVQLTMDATFLESESFALGGYAKAGVFHNRASGSVQEIYQDLATGARYTRNLRDSQDQVAFAGNLGVTGSIFLNDNWRIFGGYEVMFVSGVAVAPDQARGIRTDITDTTSLNLRDNGDALLHGGRIGVEFLFP